MNRKIDDRTYLKYLLPSLNISNLKEICREFEIKGYSRLKKVELIDFILDSQSEEEMKELIKQRELDIISEGINIALDKINGKDRESIVDIKIVNPELHEVEIKFKGFNWEITSFLSITKDNIENPDRDCDCNIGANMGFCGHFWVGFILSLKQAYFKITDWALTSLPNDFEDKIKSIKLEGLSVGTSGEVNNKSIKIINESSGTSMLMKFINESITIYDGKIKEILEKQSDFQGNITTYFLIKLINVKLGIRIKKQSDFKEEDLVKVNDLRIRISEKLNNEVDLSIGDRVTLNGKLNKDNVLGIVIKNIRKVQKI